MGELVGKQKNANYDFAKQRVPVDPMGHGDNQNLPQQPIMRSFPRGGDYRSGVTNRFEKDVEVLSDICENNR